MTEPGLGRGRNDEVAPPRPAGEDAVVANQMLAGIRNEPGEALEERERGQHDRRGAVTPPRLQEIDQLVSGTLRLRSG